MRTPIRFFVAFLLIALVSLLLPGSYVWASRLSSMSDTLSSHGVSVASNHSITFRSASGVPASGTIQLSLADATASTGSITVDDIDILISNSQVPVASTASSNTWGVAINSSTRVITLTAPSTSNLLASGSTMIIRIGTNTTSGGTGTHQMTNSSTAGNKLISVIAGPDVGLIGVRVGVLNTSSGTVSPTLDVTGTAESSAGTAATAPAPAPAPTQTTPTQTPTSPVTTTDSSSGQTTTTTTTTTQEPSPSQTTTTTTQPTSSEPTQTPTLPPPAPTPKAPEEQKTEAKTQEAPPPSLPLEEKSIIQEPTPPPPPPEETFIPITEVAPSPVQAIPSDGFIIPPPKITLPDVLPPNAVVQNLLPPATQDFIFSPSVPIQAPIQISYATGSGGIVSAAIPPQAIARASEGIRTKISAQPVSIAQYWLNIQIPGPQLQDKIVVGNKAYFISAERLNPQDASDASVSKLEEIIPVSFCFSEEEMKGVDSASIRIYSYDAIDGIRAEETAWNAANRCATGRIKHLSVFVTLANLKPGETPSQIYVLPTEEITKVESDLNTGNLGLEQLETGEAIEFFEKKIYTTADTEIALCIPASTFKKPVKKMSLFIGDEKFALVYEKSRDCFAVNMKAPSQRGKQKVVLKVIYNDDQVQIIELETVVTGALQAKLLPRVQKAAKLVQETAIVVNETVKQTVKDTEPVLQSTVVVSVPVVTAANPTIYTNALNWYHYLNHLISALLTALGLRKRRKPWGVVYNAITKDPIDLAIVRLFDKKQNKLIETQVTDKNGRFSFLVAPGDYTIDVKKPPLAFPSNLITSLVDGEYANIYRGASFTITRPDESIALSIPIDPPAPEKKQTMNLWEVLKSLSTRYARFTLFANLVISALLAIYTPEPLNIVLLVATYVFALFQLMIMHRLEKPWGIVFDALTLQPIPLVAIGIFDANSKKLLRQRLTDYVGRFNFLAPAGEYILTASKDHYGFPVAVQPKTKKYKNLYSGGNVKIAKNKAIVRINIPMEPKQNGGSAEQPPQTSPPPSMPSSQSVQPSQTPPPLAPTQPPLQSTPLQSEAPSALTVSLASSASSVGIPPSQVSSMSVQEQTSALASQNVNTDDKKMSGGQPHV